MRIVLDTNVLVSGLLNPHGAPGEIVRMMGSPELTLCVDARILAEYEEVIRRPRLQIESDMINELMDCIRTAAEVWSASPMTIDLPYQDDEAFLEVAVAARVDCLVTGNMKHYPVQKRQGVRVIAPGDFKAWYQQHQSGVD